MRRFFLFALSFCCVAAAQADPYDYRRTIAFGDSLSDNGNLAQNVPAPLLRILIETAPVYPGYFEGRFSNGPTWVELLADPTQSTGQNGSMERFWGGRAPFFPPPYVTGDGIHNVNAAVGGALTAPPRPIPPSVSYQVEKFLSLEKTFGASDLVSIQGGANDLFNALPQDSPLGSDKAEHLGRSTAVNAAANLQAVLDGGARTVLVSNLPDLGATPSYASNRPVAQAAHQASSAHNQELDRSVRRIAMKNPSANIIQMDWPSAFELIRSRPQAFGFTDITTPCFDYESKAVCENPDSHLFWDSVHPTAAGHKLLARYAALLLSTEQAGMAMASLGQVALNTRLSASDIIFRRIPLMDTGRGGGYVETLGEKGTLDGQTTRLFGASAVDYTLAGLRAGFDAGDGPFGLGASFAYQTGNMTGSLLNADMHAVQMDAYLLGRHAFWFAGLEGGISFDAFDDIRRGTGFPTLAATGATHGTGFTVAGTISAEHRLGAFTLMPAARLGYASIKIDGFTETAPILALSYTDREITTGFWTARLRASAPLLKSGAITAYGEIGYEALFSTRDGYAAKLASNTAHAAALQADVFARGLYLRAGLDAVIDDAVRLSGEYGLSLQNGNGTVHNARLNLTVSF